MLGVLPVSDLRRRGPAPVSASPVLRVSPVLPVSPVVPVVVPLEPSSVVPVVSPLAVAPELLLIASVVLPVGPGPVVASPVGSALVGGAVESLKGSPGFAGVLLVLVVGALAVERGFGRIDRGASREARAEQEDVDVGDE